MASLALSVLSFEVEAKQAMLGPFRTLDGEYSVTFDTGKISASEMKKLVRLAPPLASSYEGTSYELAPQLELCIANDPAYRDCGTRDIRTEAFYVNAQINLNRGRQALGFLTTVPHPTELKAVVDYLKRSLGFSLWLQETRFEFYTHWNTAVLKRSFEGIGALSLCPSALTEIEVARSQLEQYQLARSDWQNCLNSEFRDRLGAYPLSAWHRFLITYGIEEGPVVKSMLERAQEFEREQQYGKASALYEEIIVAYPEAEHIDEVSTRKYSDIARDRLHVLRCRISKGLDFAASSPEELSSVMKRAFREADRQRLIRMASCDFDVGVLESDNIFTLMPELAVGVLIENLREPEISATELVRFTDDLSMLQGPNRTNTAQHAFLFRKLTRGWVWFSFATSDGALFEELYKRKQRSKH